MNENTTPHPNINERLRKIAAAQKELETMTPSKEQILYEQLLEVVAQNQKTVAEAKAAVIDAKTAIPEAVDTSLATHQTTTKQDRDSAEQRLVAAIVAKLPKPASNIVVGELVTFWGVSITCLLVAGVCILIFLVVTHR